MRLSRALLPLLIACTLIPAVARDQSLAECRPCGPDALKGPLRYLLFQGCAGADFRDCCRRHDACYDILGVDKDTCDEIFRQDLLIEAAKSRKPAKARRRAEMAYLAVKWFGDGAYRSAQKIAAQKAAAAK